MKTTASPTLPPLQFTAFAVPELHGLWPMSEAAVGKVAGARSRSSSFMSYASATDTSRGSSATLAAPSYLRGLTKPNKTRAAARANGAAAQAPLLGPAVGAAGSRFVEHLGEAKQMAAPPRFHTKARKWAWPTVLSALAGLCTGIMLALKRFVGLRA